MPDASSPTFNIRFADDLRRIREDRDVSLDALHEETKIPLNLLEQFEETGLFDHRMFNRVYLRSLVRAYADVIAIDATEALGALDEALAGTYQNQLAVAYLGEEPLEPQNRPVVLEDDAATLEEAADESEGQEEITADKPTEEEPPPEALPTEESAPNERPEVPAVAWESQSPPPSQRSKPPVDIGKRRQMAQWTLIVVAVLLFSGAIWGVLAIIDRPEDPDEMTATAPADTAQTDTTGAMMSSPQPEVTIGDTLDVVVIAAEGKVQGIRITRDNDLRRPYWIEQGEAKEFPALERIVLENMLDRIRLLVEGYRYPTSRRDEEGRIIITRSDATAFLDTVSGPPVDLPSELETIRKGPIADQ